MAGSFMRCGITEKRKGEVQSVHTTPHALSEQITVNHCPPESRISIKPVRLQFSRALMLM